MTPGRANITLAGPAVFLRPKGALAFGMVVHELATNALKHGALSVYEGRVAVSWQIDEGAEPGREILRWTWRECGGPAVAKPERRGFGLSLIDRSLSHEMSGKAHMEFDAAGLHVRVSVPFDPLIVARQTSRLLQA